MRDIATMSRAQLVAEVRECEATCRNLLTIMSRGGYSAERKAALANWMRAGEAAAARLGWTFRAR